MDADEDEILRSGNLTYFSVRGCQQDSSKTLITLSEKNLYMQYLLLDADYETRDGKAILKLCLKGEKSLIGYDFNFYPYFYVVPKKEDSNLIEKLKEFNVVDVEKKKKKFFGREKEVLKVILRHPQEVPLVREKIKALEEVEEIYEYDILFARRYLIDKNLTPLDLVEVEGNITEKGLSISRISPTNEAPMPRLKILAFDIEVYNPFGAPRPEKDPIIMISMCSNYGFKKLLTWKAPAKEYDFVEVCDDEKSMLKRFEDIVREEDIDIILGYNTDNFDFPYIKKRLKKLKLEMKLGRNGEEIKISGRRGLPEAKIFGRNHVDLYHIIRRSVTLSSYILENVVREVLGIEKEKIPGKNLWEYWSEGGEKLCKLIEYAMEDAEVTLKLGEKYLPIYIELTKLIGQPLHSVARMTAGQMVEWVLIKEASRHGEIAPNKPKGEEYKRRAEETYIGGYVKEPKKGISENIAVFDFRSLYPSIIVTHNIDPSTLIIGECEGMEKVPELNYCFSNEKKGFIPYILERLIKRRSEIKQQIKICEDEEEKKILNVKQKALKILANSFYGYMGYPRARWYRKECAESVAAFARMYIKKVMKIAEEKFNFEVIYGDTDSLFVIVPKENISRVVKEFLNHVNNSLPGIIELEFEGFYKRGIFVTKKRYALIDENDRIIVKGLEFVRRDWAPIARKTQQKVLEALLKDASPEKAMRIVRKVIEDIRNRRVTLEELAIYTQLTKKISSYKNIEPHVIAAQKLEKAGVKVSPGMIIGYVIVKGSKKISFRAEPVELVSIDDYDPEYYIENQIMPAVQRIMEAIGYSKDFIKYGSTQESIKKWF